MYINVFCLEIQKTFLHLLENFVEHLHTLHLLLDVHPEFDAVVFVQTHLAAVVDQQPKVAFFLFQ